MENYKRYKILIIPAGFPTEYQPIAGNFIMEQARALSIRNDIAILYPYLDIDGKSLCQQTERCEKGIKIVTIKYGGIYVSRLAKIKSSSKEFSPIHRGKNKEEFSFGQYIVLLWCIFDDIIRYIILIYYYRKFSETNWKPDIIHAHGFIAGVPSIIIGSLYDIPVVITEHWSGFLQRTLTSYDILKARFAMNRAKIVISVTKVLENSIKSYNIGHDFAVIPNTVNTHIFPNDSQRDKNCGIKKLLFVGRLTPTKGLPYLIDAINRLGKKRSDFILDIVGDGEYRVDYERMVKEMDLERLIRFHRFMPHEKVISFMQRCDIYIQPSLYETFGVTFIEAMACGKPIIATETGGIPEIVNELTGILIPPGDITAIENAIEYMLDNYRNFSSKEISEYARDRFGYEAFSEKLNNVYDHVLNRYDNP